ncbi:recombinase family protein [Gimesia chilikensis]|uniref:recombinase family protein n=1 Tax=Gimesia chilikensis TaxID=2605989 RepID=UPI001659AD73|nr:recombinase family protein [Gimesia chilikensis]
MKHTAIYARVSTSEQSHASQVPDLERWVETHSGPIVHYDDTASGRTMQRPGWQDLEANIRVGKVAQLVVWRLDRLGRTAAGLTALFDELRQRNINLVSIKDGLDLSTPAGMLMANVLASVAQFEAEVISERIKAGVAKAKADGKQWGGSKPGRRKVSQEQLQVIKQLKLNGTPVTRIAKAVGLSRPTIYDVLRQG